MASLLRQSAQVRVRPWPDNARLCVNFASHRCIYGDQRIIVHSSVGVSGVDLELPPPPATSRAAWDLEHVLQQIHAASSPLSTHHTVIVEGTGRQLGLEVTWRLMLRPDGAFREEVTSPQLSFVCGFSGTPGTASWEVDDAGCPHELQLDDHEALLLTAWIRIGAWTLPSLRPALLVQQHQPGTDAGSSLEQDSQGALISAAGAPLLLDVRLPGGKVKVEVEVDAASWRPVGMAVRLCCDTESWQFLEWQRWGALHGLPFPRRAVHSSVSGGLQQLCVEHVGQRSETGALVESASVLAQYRAPPGQLLPPDATFLLDVSAAVQAWHTPSGHILVRPSINGLPPAGYMILDTGASGFVIEPAAADALGLESFGELQVTGMGGKVASRFRRADSFRLGPLVMQRPALMEMQCGGLVRGAPGPVVGIVGHDVFRRAVVDMPPQPQPAVQAAAEEGDIISPAAAFAFAASRGSRPTGTLPPPPLPAPAAEYRIHLHNPATCTELVAEDHWIPVVMLSSLPHLPADLHAHSSDGPRQHSSLLMLDTGAGGMDAMINAAAAAALGLMNPSQAGTSRGATSIRGIGGDASGRVTVHTEALPKLQVGGGAVFEDVRCLYATAGGAGGGIELSHYAAGILCWDLLKRCRLVVDLPRRRVAIITTQADRQ